MGTSQSHASPRSAAWDQVRRLYASGAPAAEIAGAIAGAVPDSTMAAATRGPLCALADTVHEATRSGRERPEDWLAERLADDAEAGHDLPASLARAAALRTLHALLSSGVTADPATTARTFAAESLAALFEYYVERDTPAHTGGTALPTVASASLLSQAVATEARAAVMAQSAAAPGTATTATVVATLMLGALEAMRGRAPLGA